jgi:hypothetical protein
MPIFEKQRGSSMTKPAAQSAPRQTNFSRADRRRGLDYDSGIAKNRRQLTTRKMQVQLVPISLERAVVLSVGDDARLLETRELVLASAGYIVHSVNSDEILGEEFMQQIDIAIICHSVSTKRAERVAKEIHSLSPDIPILHLGAFRACPEGTYERTLIDFHPKPEVMLKTLEQMLPRPRSRGRDSVT